MSSLQSLSPAAFDAELLMQLPPPLPSLLREVGGQDYDLVTLSALTSISAVLPNVHTYYHKAILKPNLYSLVVARSAAMKSRAAVGRACLKLIEQQLASESQEESVRRKVVQSSMTSPEAFLSALAKNEGRGLIYSTEADTLTNTLGKDYGKGLSELLRQAYANEEISQDFKTSGSVYIAEPAVSIFLTGTPGQLNTLIDDVENGLLSRFSYYVMGGEVAWREPFANGGNSDGLQAVQTDASQVVFSVWSKLRRLKRSLKMDFASSPRFGRNGYWANEIEQGEKGDAELALALRAAEREVRLAMILEVLRIGKDLDKVGDVVEVHSDTLEQAAHLSEILLDHSRISLQMIRGVDKADAIANCKAQGLSTRKAAERLGVSKSTVARKYREV